MRHRGAKTTAVAAVLLLVADLVTVAAIGRTSGATNASPPTAAIATTTSTTPLVPVGVYPLTGLPAYSAARLARPALSIKVDNAPDARPQAGLNSADLVTEELVEGGLTRLLATFQSSDAAAVGPIRSARPVDADLLHQLGGGLFAFSGASGGALAPVRAKSGAALLTPDNTTDVFVRANDRRAPANLFATTAALYAAGPHHDAPPPLFSYGAVAPATTPAQKVSLAFSANASSGWQWSSGVYERTQDHSPAMLAGDAVVTANDVVILSVATTTSGVYDVLGHQTPVPVVTGSGTAWVLRDGLVVKGTWTRPTFADSFALAGADGQIIALGPGRTWIELLPTPSQPAFSVS